MMPTNIAFNVFSGSSDDAKPADANVADNPADANVADNPADANVDNNSA